MKHNYSAGSFALRGVSPSICFTAAPSPCDPAWWVRLSLTEGSFLLLLLPWSGAYPGSPLPDRHPSDLVGPTGSSLSADVGACRGPCRVGDLLRCLPLSGYTSPAPRSPCDRMTALLLGVCSSRRAMEQSLLHLLRQQSRHLFLCRGSAPLSSLRGPLRLCWLDVLLVAPSGLSLFSNSYRWPRGAAESF